MYANRTLKNISAAYLTIENKKYGANNGGVQISECVYY